MRTVLLLLLVSVSFLTFAQDTINQRDEKGLKQGHWIYYGKDRPESGVPLDGKVEEGYYVDDRKEGEWIKYELDGKTPRIKGIYENNRPKTNCVFGIYPGSKPPRELGTFEKNHYRDSLIRFYEDGKREYAAYYDSLGKEQGWVRFYYQNGVKEFEYFAKNGVPTGKAYRFFDNADTLEIVTYNSEGKHVSSVFRERSRTMSPQINEPERSNAPPKIIGTPNTNGVLWKPNGYNKVYNEDKEIWQDGVFKDGSLWDGKVYYYDRDIILLRVKVFKGGSYHSDGQL